MSHEIMIWRQFTNDYLLVEDIALFGILAIYLTSYMRAARWQASDIRAVFTMPRIQAATWMLVHVVGLTIQRGWAIFLLRAVAKGQNLLALESAFPIYLVGSVICAIGVSGTLYTFTLLAGTVTPTPRARILMLLLSVAVGFLFGLLMLAS